MFKRKALTTCLIFGMIFGLNCCYPTSMVSAGNSHANYEKATYTQKQLNDQNIMAILWVQTSAEYQALCYQAYNVAELELQRVLKHKRRDKPLAVVVDCDNTVLQDGPAQAYYIDTNESYNSKTWEKWVNWAEAVPVPGALEFLQKAAQKGVAIFYVPNRKEATELEGTVRNLKSKGFPMVDYEHVILRTEPGGKDKRFEKIAKEYNIALFIGDNLSDMPLNVYHLPLNQRNEIAQKEKKNFGTKYIILPNPMYGDWESALGKNYYKLTPEQKDALRRSMLNKWVDGNNTTR